MKIKRTPIKELKKLTRFHLSLAKKEDRLYVCIERELVRDFLFYLSQIETTPK